MLGAEGAKLWHCVALCGTVWHCVALCAEVEIVEVVEIVEMVEIELFDFVC